MIKQFQVTVYRTRGFDCLIRHTSEECFEAVVLNSGDPVRVEWNGRTTWHSLRRAKDMTAQFVKCRMPIPVDSPT